MRRLSPISWILSDASLKLASLVLALFVWLYVRSEEKPVQDFSVPLEIEGLGRDLAMAGEAPDSVAVRVRAPDTTLRNLSPGRFHARVKLDASQPGEVRIPLTGENVHAPLGVEVIRIEPAELTLKLERRIAREVPVVARITGRPAAGYESDGYTLTPDKAMVEGPESVVRKVREAVTDETDITDRSESFDTVVGLVPDRGGARITSQTAAQLRVNIREQRVARTFAAVPLVPNLPSGVGYHVSFQPESVTVVVEGRREALDALKPGNIRALLDLEGMGPREAPYAVRPRIAITPGDVGAGVAVHSVNEPTINVKISR